MVKVDYVLVNGRVLTAPNPATALAISGPWIVYVGDDAGAHALTSPDTRVVNLAGLAVMPGFVDAHNCQLTILEM
jgi:predicted amidohydrolase YtcJ